MPQFFTLPKPAPTPNGAPLPQEAPNRPLGQNWLDDAVDAILGGLGIDNPLSPQASKATQIGGLIGAALPLGMAARVKAAPSEARMAELVGKFGGTSSETAAAEAPGFVAYHGSPHDFEKFDLSKIGSGEGAQAYGHGLYFADNEGVAKAYRNTTTTSVHGPAFPDGDARNGIASILAMRPEETAVPLIRKVYGPVLGDNVDAAIAEAKAANSTRGKMYQVRIKADPEQFLDWDKPLSEQPHVNNVLRNVIESHGLPTYPSPHAETNILKSKLEDGSITGGEAYQLASKALGKPSPMLPTVKLPQKPAATDALRNAGIPGIKYLDQGSRAAGEGSRNYVVFNDSIIDILKKYGISLPFAGAAAALAPQGKQ